MLAVFFDSATSEDVTMDAIREIRSIAGKQCFVSGMSALVTDLKDLCEQEEPIYVALAVACACAAMMLLSAHIMHRTQSKVTAVIGILGYNLLYLCYIRFFRTGWGSIICCLGLPTAWQTDFITSATAG